VALALSPVFLANRNDQQTDFKNIQFRAGNVILTGDVDRSIRALEMPKLGFESDVEIRQTKQDMQYVSGYTDFMAGTKGSANLVDTATGVATVVREANAKYALKVSTFEAGPLRKLIEACHAYHMTYMPERKRIHVLGPEGWVIKDITLDDILCECNFIVEPGSSVPLDQLTRRDHLLQLLDRVLRLPMVVRIDKYIKEVLEASDIRNVDDLLVRKSGPATEQQDQALAEAENIALGLGMDIPLVGNDALHLAVHGKLDPSTIEPRAQEKLLEHIQQHMEHATIASGPQAQGFGQLGPVGGVGGLPGIPGSPTPAPGLVGPDRGL
jgi:hypothetical protein